MMSDLSQDQLCFPGSNASCVMAQFSVGTRTVLYVLFASGILVTIVGNCVVIVSIGHFKQLQNPTNVLLLSLALADLLVGVIVMPFSSIRTVHGCWFYGDDFCELHSSFDMFLTTVSIFHLVCIAVDRQQAICNPLHYSRKITMSVAWIMVCVSWALAALFSYGLLYSKANVAGLEIVTFSLPPLGNPGQCYCLFFPCTVMVCLYSKIFLVAKEHSEHKAAKTLAIVLGAFIFCWMPFFINSIIDAYTGFITPAAIFEAFVWLGYFNSTLNPKCFYLIVTLKIFDPHSSTVK
ncbi:hypothetical protein INR49_008149, partial [Caranx melampygus]